MQLTEHIHALRIPFRVDANGVSLERFVVVYLIYSDAIYLIDSGVAGSEKVIRDYIETSGRDYGEIAMVLQTHSHPDHIGATRAIRDATGCSVAAHPLERAWIEDVELQARERPVPGFHRLVRGSVPVDRALEEGDLIPIGGDLALRVLHTPGHSPGSVTFLFSRDGALFSGDAIPLGGDLPVYVDAVESVRSLRRLRQIGEADLLLAAWDDPLRGNAVQERMDAGLRWLRRIQESVNRAVGSTGSTDPAVITGDVLLDLGIPPTAVNPLVVRSIQAHLQARCRADVTWE